MIFSTAPPWKRFVPIVIPILATVVGCSGGESNYKFNIADVRAAFGPMALEYLQDRTVMWRGGHMFERADSLDGPRRDSVLAVWRGLDAFGRDLPHIWGRDGYVLFYRSSDEVVAWVGDCDVFESDPVIIYHTYSHGDRCSDTEWLELHVTLPPWP